MPGQQTSVGPSLVIGALLGIQRGQEGLRMDQRDQTGHVAEPEAGHQPRLQRELLAQPQRVADPDEVRGAREFVIDAIQAAVGRDHPVAQDLAQPHHLEDRRAALGVPGEILLRHDEQRRAVRAAERIGQPLMQFGLVGIVGER